MDSGQRGRIAGGLAGLAAGLSPLNSFTFVVALILTAIGAWSWFRQSGEPRSSFPLYATIAASYAGGFLIGRVFRTVLKTAAVVAAILIGGLALLNHAHVDTSKAKQAVEAGSSWAQQQATQAKKYLRHWLPSGTFAGIGVFAGGRRRRIKSETPERAS
jgi:hypothetical protein